MPILAEKIESYGHKGRSLALSLQMQADVGSVIGDGVKQRVSVYRRIRECLTGKKGERKRGFGCQPDFLPGLRREKGVLRGNRRRMRTTREAAKARVKGKAILLLR